MANWFVALPCPAATWYAKLKGAPETLRLLHPDDLHLTVAFLGDVGPERAQRAYEAVRHCGLHARTVRLGRLVPMGPPRRWSALAAEVEDAATADPPLASLLEAPRDLGRAAAGIEPEGRPFRPHVTVGRVRRRGGQAGRKQALAWAQAIAPTNAPVVLDRLALFTRAEPGAARTYTIVEESDLSVR